VIETRETHWTAVVRAAAMVGVAAIVASTTAYVVAVLTARPSAPDTCIGICFPSPRAPVPELWPEWGWLFVGVALLVFGAMALACWREHAREKAAAAEARELRTAQENERVTRSKLEVLRMLVEAKTEDPTKYVDAAKQLGLCNVPPEMADAQTDESRQQTES